jgi:hypothetical protein
VRRPAIGDNCLGAGPCAQRTKYSSRVATRGRRSTMQVLGFEFSRETSLRYASGHAQPPHPSRIRRLHSPHGKRWGLFCLSSNASPRGRRIEMSHIRHSWNLLSSGRILMRTWRRQHASIRANPGRRDLLLSPLRSTLFGDTFAAFQKCRLYRKMRGLPADYGQAGFNQRSDLQAHSPT